MGVGGVGMVVGMAAVESERSTEGAGPCVNYDAQFMMQHSLVCSYPFIRTAADTPQRGQRGYRVNGRPYPEGARNCQPYCGCMIIIEPHVHDV